MAEQDRMVPKERLRLTARNGKTAVIIAVGSILGFKGDAIVNAANEGCVGGFGVDEAINNAAGVELKAARRELGGCSTGQAKVTPSFGHTKVKWIIHAVGPVYRSNALARRTVQENDALLAAAYRASLDRAREYGAKTMAFTLLSAGVFRGDRSLVDVLTIGLDTLLEFAHEGIAEITLVAYTVEEEQALLSIAAMRK